MLSWMKTAIAGISGIVSGLTVAPVRGLCHGKVFLQADGTTDLSRVLGAFVVMAFLAYEGYALIVLKQPFDPSAFGTGAAALLAGAAVFVLGHNFASR